ncbi:MAG TPA: hypothetical protein VFX02_14470 [Gammaproteobacteria bacterium]|nr:hypothetical protein [Gammaproteobacteria bacterium]
MSRYFRFIVLSLSLLSAGCQKSATYTIYNNTPLDLVVELQNGEMEWEAGTPLQIDGAMQQRLLWLEEAGRRFPVLTIRHDGKTARYSFTSPDYPIPAEYRSKGEYRFQLQQDWNLYLMLPGDPYPAPGKHLRFQPQGFPKAQDKISGKAS